MPFVRSQKAAVIPREVLAACHSCCPTVGETKSCGFAADFIFPVLPANFFTLQSKLIGAFQSAEWAVVKRLTDTDQVVDQAIWFFP